MSNDFQPRVMAEKIEAGPKREGIDDGIFWLAQEPVSGFPCPESSAKTVDYNFWLMSM